MNENLRTNWAAKMLLSLLLPFTFLISQVNAQEPWAKSYPSVGEKVKAHTFTDLVNYPSKQVSLDELRGKWVILDVWAFSCGGCLASFPKMDSLNDQFKDQIQLVMVGATKSMTRSMTTKQVEKITKDIYKTLDRKHDLGITVAFDSVFYAKYAVNGLPQVFVIDPEGVIRAKTTNVTSEQLEAILAGKTPSFERSLSMGENPSAAFRKDLPLLTRGAEANGGVDTAFLFRSLLMKHEVGGEVPPHSFTDLYEDNEIVNRGWFNVTGVTVQNLLQLACFGASSWDSQDPRYYAKRSNEIEWDIPNLNMRADLSRRYSYSLKVPQSRSTPEFMMKMVRSDLLKYFSLEARVEKIEKPVLFLDVADRNKIKASKENDGKILVSDRKAGSFTGYVFQSINLPWLAAYLSSRSVIKMPVIDRTGIQHNITMDFRADMLDLDSIQKELLRHGLRLTKGTTKMETIVAKHKPV